MPRSRATPDPSGDRGKDGTRLVVGRRSRLVSDGDVVDGVLRDDIQARVVEPERGKSMALADTREELAELADRRPRSRSSRLGRDRGLERHTDESQLSVPQPTVCDVEREHLGKDDGERGPVREMTARTERVSEGVDQPDARATRLPDPGEMRRHEHLRARLEIG